MSGLKSAIDSLAARSTYPSCCVSLDHRNRSGHSDVVKIEHVYFIERGVASLLARTRRDGPVEVAIVGRFGFIGVATVLGTMRSPNRWLMEVPGEALRINTNDIRCAMEEAPLVRQHLLNYIHALFVQNTQTALCNVRHQLEERLCRWLLLASDRLDEKVVPVTYDQLAMILRVRRAGVTTTLAELAGLGGVAKTRGAIEIDTRDILEAKTCECYRIICWEYSRITNTGSDHYTLAKASVVKRELPVKIIDHYDIRRFSLDHRSPPLQSGSNAKVRKSPCGDGLVEGPVPRG